MTTAASVSASFSASSAARCDSASLSSEVSAAAIRSADLLLDAGGSFLGGRRILSCMLFCFLSRDTRRFGSVTQLRRLTFRFRNQVLGPLIRFALHRFSDLLRFINLLLERCTSGLSLAFELVRPRSR